MGDALDNVTLPVPALQKPVEMWTGKQVFSLLLRPWNQTKCALVAGWSCLKQAPGFLQARSVLLWRGGGGGGGDSGQ